jgi:glycosyltransferase involved in cell wall biosynthesis
MKIAIVMPAYNEEKRISKTLEEFSKFFEKLRRTEKLEYTILVVINGTKDNTERVVKNYIKKNKNITYLNLIKGGKGYAVIEGFKWSLKKNKEIIGFVDADLATSPEQYWRLIQNLSNFDGAIANRYLPESKINPPFSFRRTVVSTTFNLIVRSLFGLPYTDTQCGAKVFTQETLRRVIPDMTITEWAFDIDLLYACKRHNLKIKSVPTIWYEKEGSTLKVGRVSIQMLLAVIQLRILRSRYRNLLKVIKPTISIIYKAMRNK